MEPSGPAKGRKQPKLQKLPGPARSSCCGEGGGRAAVLSHLCLDKSGRGEAATRGKVRPQRREEEEGRRCFHGVPFPPRFRGNGRIPLGAPPESSSRLEKKRRGVGPRVSARVRRRCSGAGLGASSRPDARSRVVLAGQEQALPASRGVEELRTGARLQSFKSLRPYSPPPIK